MVKIRARKKKIINGPKAPKYQPWHPVQVYQYARAGLTDRSICKALGIVRPTFDIWKKKYSAIRYALDDARAEGNTIQEYIIGRLSPHLRVVWDEITKSDDTIDGERAIQGILDKVGKRARQTLFIHALIYNLYSFTKACNMLRITRPVVEGWMAEPSFRALVTEINWHKKNFVEDALMRAVARGETAAVIFANRTLNRDRGYNENVELKVTSDSPFVTPVSELGLSLADRKKLLEKMRANRESGIKAIDVKAEIIE